MTDTPAAMSTLRIQILFSKNIPHYKNQFLGEMILGLVQGKNTVNGLEHLVPESK